MENHNFDPFDFNLIGDNWDINNYKKINPVVFNTGYSDPTGVYRGTDRESYEIEPKKGHYIDCLGPSYSYGGEIRSKERPKTIISGNFLEGNLQFKDPFSGTIYIVPKSNINKIKDVKKRIARSKEIDDEQKEERRFQRREDRLEGLLTTAISEPLSDLNRKIDSLNITSSFSDINQILQNLKKSGIKLNDFIEINLFSKINENVELARSQKNELIEKLNELAGEQLSQQLKIDTLIASNEEIKQKLQSDKVSLEVSLAGISESLKQTRSDLRETVNAKEKEELAAEIEKLRGLAFSLRDAISRQEEIYRDYKTNISILESGKNESEKEIVRFSKLINNQEIRLTEAITSKDKKKIQDLIIALKIKRAVSESKVRSSDNLISSLNSIIKRHEETIENLRENIKELEETNAMNSYKIKKLVSNNVILTEKIDGYIEEIGRLNNKISKLEDDNKEIKNLNEGELNLLYNEISPGIKKSMVMSREEYNFLISNPREFLHLFEERIDGDEGRKLNVSDLKFIGRFLDRNRKSLDRYKKDEIIKIITKELNEYVDSVDPLDSLNSLGSYGSQDDTAEELTDDEDLVDSSKPQDDTPEELTDDEDLVDSSKPQDDTPKKKKKSDQSKKKKKTDIVGSGKKTIVKKKSNIKGSGKKTNNLIAEFSKIKR
jgi:chromosome segregation ATPase